MMADVKTWIFGRRTRFKLVIQNLWVRLKKKQYSEEVGRKIFYKIRQYFDILQNIGSNCYLEDGLGKWQIIQQSNPEALQVHKKAKGKNEESKHDVESLRIHLAVTLYAMCFQILQKSSVCLLMRSR